MNNQTAPSVDQHHAIAQVTYLVPREVMRIDPEPLARLQAALGPQGAEDVVCRALEDISHRLRRLTEDHARCDVEKMIRGARSISAVSLQIGLSDLACAAGHVLDCAGQNAADQRVDAALSATLARLIRVGRRAVTEIGQVRFSGY